MLSSTTSPSKSAILEEMAVVNRLCRILGCGGVEPRIFSLGATKYRTDKIIMAQSRMAAFMTLIHLGSLSDICHLRSSYTTTNNAP
jgi:hypothetical protein